MTAPTLTARQFAVAYAERSGMPLAELAAVAPNREVRPCDCGSEACEGWALVRTEPGGERGIPLRALVES